MKSLPMPAWVRRYQSDSLKPDLVAGLTLAAYLLPAAVGDASLANLPPEAGLYACLFSGLVFGLVCSSRHTVVTVTSALSLLIGASVGSMSAGDPVRHAALAAAVALMVGVIAFIAWAIRAGQAVAFFSETVLVGFKAGLALYLASTQLPKLFGFKGTQGDFWDRIFYFVRHVGDTHSISLAIGAAALAVLIAGKLWFKKIPVGFLVVISAIAATRLLGLGERGVGLLGPVPEGLPSLGFPTIGRTDLSELLPIAMACFVIAAVESAAIGRMFAQKHGYRLDANQELLAIAVANAAAGLGRSFPVSGGMSQSLVNESAGARTPLSGMVAAGCTLAIALFASGLLRNLPQPVLAAIVLSAIISLFDIAALRHIWHYSRSEFAIALTALVGVLSSGPENGVLIGAAISITLLLRQTASPRVTELGRIPGTTRYGDVTRHPENERTPGVLIARCESSLLYFNVEHVRDRLTEMIEQRQAPVRLVVFFLGTVPRIDLAGAELIAEMYRSLRTRDIDLRLAESNGFVRDALRRIGFDRTYGPLTDLSVDGILSTYGRPGHALTA